MIKAPTTFIERLKFIGPSIIVTGSVVGSGSIALSPLLQNALVSMCDGQAARTFQIQDDSENGAESWICLCNIYTTPTRSRAAGRMTIIPQWKFDMSNLEIPSITGNYILQYTTPNSRYL